MVVEVDKLVFCSEMESEDAAATELLERARRLCLAARQLELPTLLPKFESGVVETPTPEDDAEGDWGDRARRSSSKGSQRESRDKLPLIGALPSGPKTKRHKKSAKQSEDTEKKLLEETRRLDGEKRNQKVKQAQERARARVARTNQLEQEQTLRAAAEQQSGALNTAEECDEKIRRAQNSRRRAKERIRMKRQKEASETTPPSTAPGLGAEPAKLKSFRGKTIKRLQASIRQVNRSDKIEHTDIPGRSEAIDAKQKLMERKLRQETAARLSRMKQLAENQSRQEQEEFTQGLQKFKNKQRELDRVAKGLSKQPLLPEINEPATFETEEPREEIFPASRNAGCLSPVQGEVVLAPNQDVELSSDSDDPNNTSRQASCPDQTVAASPRTAEMNSRRTKSRCKVPAWKQLPVPIEPTKGYSYKAILPPYSRASSTVPRYSTAATLVSETRLRAQQLARQMK